MMAGRKRIDLEMRGSKGNRQRIWEAIRAKADGFTGRQIAHASEVDDTTVRSYLRALLKGKYVEVVSGVRFELQTLCLTKDVGVEAPAITQSGLPSTAGQVNEAMWRCLRIVGEVNADELAVHASAAVPVSRWTAKGFLKWLKLAGYLVEVSPSKPGTLARYKLAPGKYTGPRPPMIQRVGQVFDANLGEVVYRQVLEEEI